MSPGDGDRREIPDDLVQVPAVEDHQYLVGDGIDDPPGPGGS
jgi:hypothetical protein